MTPAQLAVFRLVSQGRVSMFCDRFVWHFRDDQGDVINRRTVRALERAGFVSAMYFRDGASLGLTETGRKRAAEWDRRQGKN